MYNRCHPSSSINETRDILITDESNVSDVNVSEKPPGTPPPSTCPEHTDMDPGCILKEIRNKNVGNIIGHLNINSIRNKMQAIKTLISENIDILIISETKIDDSFPINQFNMEGFSTPIKADRNSEGGVLLVSFREDILYSIQLPENIEVLFTEFKLRNKKWLLLGCYSPKEEYISYFSDHIGRNLDNPIGNHENLLIIGDLNFQMIEDEMK